MINTQIGYRDRKPVPSWPLRTSLLGFAVGGKMNAKVCKKCGEIKLLNEFSRHPTCKEGYNTLCKSCVNLKSREWYGENRERDCANGKRWYSENKEKRVVTIKIWADANKEKTRERSKLWAAKNKERRSVTGKDYYKKNKERIAARTKVYELANRGKILARKRTYVANNLALIQARRSKYCAENKERFAAYGRSWRKENPGISNAAWVRHHAAKLKAIPAWANKFFIGEIYHLARIRTEITGITWQVDHVIPLQSEKVCGLHCAANLQVITATENSSKSNRRWPDMP